MLYAPISRKFEYDENGIPRAGAMASTLPVIFLCWRGVFNGDGSFQEIFLDGVNGSRYKIPIQAIILFEGNAVCFKSDYSKIVTFSLRFSIFRDAMGNTTLKRIQEQLDDEISGDIPPEAFTNFAVMPDKTETETNSEIYLKVLNPDTYLWKITGTINQILI